MVMANDPNVVPQGITILVKANARAKEVAAAVVANSTLLSRSSTREWAETFTATVEGMIAKLLSVGADGIYPWQKNPALMSTVGDYIASEAQEMQTNQTELLSIAAGLRQGAQAIGRQASAALVEVAKGAAEGFKPKGGDWVPTVVGVGIAAVAIAYVWRAFR